jgi:hypothetical protein
MQLPARLLLGAGLDRLRRPLVETSAGNVDQAAEQGLCLPAGAGAQGVVAGLFQGPHSPHRILRLIPVGGDARQHQRVVAGMALVPGAQQGVHLAAEAERQQAVHGIAHQGMAETKLAGVGLALDQAALHQRVDIGAQVVAAGLPGAGAAQRVEAEHAPDDTGGLQGVLLARGEAVDARDHHALDRVGNRKNPPARGHRSSPRPGRNAPPGRTPAKPLPGVRTRAGPGSCRRQPAAPARAHAACRVPTQ